MKYHKSNSRLHIMTFTLVLLNTLCITATADARRPRSGGNYRQFNQANRNRNIVPRANTAAISAARKQLTAAEAELAKARYAFDNVVAPLRAKFDASPEMSDALAALRDTQTAHDQADATLEVTLQTEPNYQVAIKNKSDAVALLDALRKSAASQDQIATAAGEVLRVGTIATQIHAAAENADTTVVDTRSKLVAADAKVSDLRKRFQESLTADQQWIDAKKILDESKAKLTAAQNALTAAMSK